MAGCVRSQAIFPASSPSQRISFENPSCTSKQQISCSSLRYTIHAWHSPVSVIWSRSYVYSRFLISTRLDMSLHIFGLVFGKVTTFLILTISLTTLSSLSTFICPISCSTSLSSILCATSRFSSFSP